MPSASKTINVGSYGKFELRLDQTSQDQGNWTSTLRVRLYMENTGSGGSYNNNGVPMGIYSGAFPNWTGNVPFSIPAKSRELVVDRSYEIEHDSDGTLEINVEAELGSTGTLTFGNGGTVRIDNFEFDTLATVPEKPSAWVIQDVTNNSVQGDATFQGDGGVPRTQWQLRYRKNGTSTYYYQNLNLSNGIGTVGGLTSDTKYYFWNRIKNDVGWGPWSNSSSATTHDVPDKPQKPTFDSIAQNTAIFELVANGNNGSSIDDYRWYYNTENTTAGASVFTETTDQPTGSPNGRAWIPDLEPGEKYYVWGRVHNEYGWSPLSSVATVTLVAGAYVDVNGTPKRAVPYVNVNGTWKLAEGYTKTFGVWRKTG